ncbi:SDR family oxidoreductase [Cellulomonas sp. ES6]|uniref:SDR family oxidoreductase n=1 Tax=Cellulomonas sp. ES6 TaxID=3039384 RepID=UPI0019C9A5F0|nr:SDR family oxidoreductase [Cellulomonas sp. ES6]MBD3781144.1 SDR family oxidoreductase [Micrococcales bacterium]WHP16114.1 SDR family oxidoreductase [Cellulomonas sp. ES6]
MDDGLIVVTGASGRIGRRLAVRLAAEGAQQRLVVRSPDRAPQLPGTETEIALSPGYLDVGSMRAAFAGARTVFLVSGRESADRVTEHRAAVDAAVDAGVERVVYLSFMGAAPDATFTFARDHWATEEHIRASGLRYTFLRDCLYHDAIVRFVGEDGVIRGPAGQGRVAAVAHDDVADVATAVLLDERDHAHDGQAYDVTGPTAYPLAEAAQSLSSATGRAIRYEPETVEQAYASRAGYGAEPWEVEGWVTSYEAIATGELEPTSPTVRRLAGRPAQSFSEWLTLNPAAWEHLRA